MSSFSVAPNEAAAPRPLDAVDRSGALSSQPPAPLPDGNAELLDRVILHIGTHKTGTTAIQASLKKASASLLSRGVLYPLSGRLGAGHAGLALLAEHHGEAPGASDLEHRLLEEVATVRPATLVLSAERFSSNGGPRRARWASWLCGHLDARRVQVIGYVRPQWEFIESAYAQRVKAGITWVDFEGHLGLVLSQADSEPESSRYHYPSVFEPWRRMFGEGLEVRPCSAELLIGHDAVEDFWHTAGLGSLPAPRGGHLNSRADAKTTEMLRALRSVLADHGVDEQASVRQAMRRAHLRIEARLPREEPFRAVTPDLLARIADSFRASNATFVRDFLGGEYASLFEPPANLSPVGATWSLEGASSEERQLYEEIVAEALSSFRLSAHSTRGRAVARPPR